MAQAGSILPACRNARKSSPQSVQQLSTFESRQQIEAEIERLIGMLDDFDGDADDEIDNPDDEPSDSGLADMEGLREAYSRATATGGAGCYA